MKRLIKKSQFDNINALRFLAVLIIFLSHSFITTDPQIQVSSLYLDLRQFTANLNVAAYSLLFILTGFLNTWTIFEERFIYKKMNVLRFYMRRILGILPLYLLIFIIGYYIAPRVPVGLHSENLHAISAFDYLTFTFNFRYEDTWNPLTNIMGNMWSIAATFHFILAWPLLMEYFRRNEGAFFIIALLAFGVSAWFWSGNASFRYNTLNILCDFVVGAYIAYISFFKYAMYSRLRSSTRRTIGFIYLAFFAFIVFRKTILFEAAKEVPAQILFIAERLVISGVLAFFIFEQNFSSNSVFKLAKLRIFNFPGTISYGFYAYSAIGSIIGFQAMLFIVGEQSMAAIFILEPAVGLAATFALAWFSYEYFEKKFLRRRKNYNPTREYNPAEVANVNKKPA